MNIPVSPEEYQKLIELAYLGEWVVNAHHDPDFQDEAASGVLQKLMSAHAIEDVGRDEETQEYFMKSEWVERLYDSYILDYDDHVFWDELTERLAQRDLAKQRGVNLDDVNRDDDLLALRPLEDHYRVELEEHGIERVEVVGDY